MRTVLQFLHLVNDPDGLNIGMRHISLSTCGLVPEIRRAGRGEPTADAFRLPARAAGRGPQHDHAGQPAGIPSPTLLAACRDYYAKTGRRISFEYAMIRGVNDTPEMAAHLIRLLHGLAAHVNLIPLNHVDGEPAPAQHPRMRCGTSRRSWSTPGSPATVRRTLGGDIDASCGQLRRKHEKLGKGVPQ